MRTPRSIQKQRQRQIAELERKPWSSNHFGVQYDDREDFPWVLFVLKTNKVVRRFRRKFAAQLEATKLDAIVNNVVS